MIWLLCAQHPPLSLPASAVSKAFCVYEIFTSIKVVPKDSPTAAAARPLAVHRSLPGPDIQYTASVHEVNDQITIPNHQSTRSQILPGRLWKRSSDGSGCSDSPTNHSLATLHHFGSIASNDRLGTELMLPGSDAAACAASRPWDSLLLDRLSDINQDICPSARPESLGTRLGSNVHTCMR